jgi:hypothetical protein
MLVLATLLLCAAPAQADVPQFLPLAETSRNQEPSRLVLKSMDWDMRSGAPQLPAEIGLTQSEALQSGYWIVQAKDSAGVLKLRSSIQKLGGTVFDYVPHNALEVRLSIDAVAVLRSRSVPMLPIYPAWKMDSPVGVAWSVPAEEQAAMLVSVEYWPDLDLEEELLSLADLGAEVVGSYEIGRYLRAEVRLHAGQLGQLARQPGVRWIQESATGQLRNNRSRWVIQTNRPGDKKLWRNGITGLGVIIGHIDGQLYLDSCYFRDPNVLVAGPTHRKVLWMSGGTGISSHGTHTAGSAAGNAMPTQGTDSNAGMAPEAKLVHDSNLPNTSNFLSKLDNAHNYGARIHTNSWGGSLTTYGNWARDVDAYSHDYEDGLVLFAVSNGTLIKNPENAKSSLSVSATLGDDQERWGIGGIGPTADGRLKPEVMAPGCDVESAAAGNTCLVIADCGTSMACPIVAGGNALLKQYFQDGFYPSGVATPSDSLIPSGSLLRAATANSAMDMSGVTGYPGYQEGWGRLLLDNVAYFAGDRRQLWIHDVLHNQGITHATSQSNTFTVGSNAKYLRITMAFADVPGSAMAAAPVVNDLDLKITAPNGTVYHGNTFMWGRQTTVSRPNPASTDQKNTLEQVFVVKPQAGIWTAEVVGADVPTGPQGYALVATW